MFVEENNTCTVSCVSLSVRLVNGTYFCTPARSCVFYNLTVTNISMRVCTDACDASEFQLNGQCIKTCSEGQYQNQVYNDGCTAAQSIEYFVTLGQNTVAVQQCDKYFRQLDGSRKQCTDTCDEYLTEKGECVGMCPNNTVHLIQGNIKRCTA